MSPAPRPAPPAPFDPAEAFARARHEFGEHGGVNMSVEASTTFTVLDARTMPAIFQGQRGPEESEREGAVGCYLYGRHFNPTVYVLGRYLAALEDTQAAYCCASGISATACALMQLTRPGESIVASHAIYGGTFALLKEFLPARTGVTTTFVDVTDLGQVERAFTPRTRVLFVETISNPTLVVADLPRLAALAHAHGCRLVVDNTFSPMMVTPARHGADVVVHSLTKYIGGASDIIAGCICASRELITSLMDVHSGALMLLGPTMDPRIAFELSLRLPHLPLRLKEHARRAQAFAERLQARGLPVTYPGLATHPQHALLAGLLNPGYGFGGMLSLDLGTRERAYAFMENLQNEQRFGFLAVSLGYFDTLMSCSASSTSSEMSDDALRAAGIAPGLVRISLGYTGSLEQRWAQLERALDALGVAG